MCIFPLDVIIVKILSHPCDQVFNCVIGLWEFDLQNKLHIPTLQALATKTLLVPIALKSQSRKKMLDGTFTHDTNS